MPRFYFDINHDLMNHRDEVGVSLPDVGSAQAEAVRVLPDVVRGPLADQPHHRFSLDVRGENGAYVFRATIVMSDESVAADAPGLQTVEIQRQS